MMPAEYLAPQLIDKLPAVRGRLEADVPLGRYTWFKVGGPAEVFFRPADTADLAAFLQACPDDVAVTVFGNASNMLVRDGGVEGVVVRLGNGFSSIDIDGDVLTIGAGAADLSVARFARDQGFVGLEFLAGIPGTMGGAVFMNAGAYDKDITDVFVDCRVLDRAGTEHILGPAEMDFSYRRSALAEGMIVTSVRLKGMPGDGAEIDARMSDIQTARESTQPIRTPTGGSTFKNPPGTTAWKLIDDAGCRGLRQGSVTVSEQHCNFLINDGDASAADIEALGEDVRRRVHEASGVTLEWEIRRIGIPVEPSVRKVTP
ncbi:MAG: UDP-N-acetylmuramate dehydrogenase [Rhodospirillaceae bacterium]|nr:UDP-N-acetylmuramate dehydrogenase [Rhodospirillaceae bacterium]